MRSPRWLRRNVLVIFLVFLTVYLMVYAARFTWALIEGGGLNVAEVFSLAFLGLGAILFILNRIRPSTDDEQPKGDLPTAVIERVEPPTVIATVHQLPIHRPSPTTYQVTPDGDTPQARVLQIPQRRRAGDDPPPPDQDGFDWGALSLREDTGGYPPVPPGREEVT